MKLSTNNLALDFSTVDIWGNEFHLSDRHTGKILLMFFRYSECPLCNLRLSEIKRSLPELQRHNIQLVAVFQSPTSSLIKNIANRHDFDFVILPDEQRRLYDLYSVKPSWYKSFKFFTTTGIDQFVSAWKKGYKPGKVEGKLHQIPADFLIDKDGRILIAHYGNSVMDHLPIHEIILKA